MAFNDWREPIDNFYEKVYSLPTDSPSAPVISSASYYGLIFGLLAAAIAVLILIITCIYFHFLPKLGRWFRNWRLGSESANSSRIVSPPQPAPIVIHLRENTHQEDFEIESGIVFSNY